MKDEILKIEKGFWMDGADYFERFLADDAVLVLPHPVGVLKRADAVASVHGAPRWSAIEIEDQKWAWLHEEVAVLTYRVTARREGEVKPYRALISSLYTPFPKTWKLAFHQQTPISEDETGSVTAAVTPTI